MTQTIFYCKPDFPHEYVHCLWHITMDQGSAILFRRPLDIGEKAT